MQDLTAEWPLSCGERLSTFAYAAGWTISAFLEQPPAGVTPPACDDLFEHGLLALLQVVVFYEVFAVFSSGVVVEHAEFVTAAVRQMQHFDMHPTPVTLEPPHHTDVVGTLDAEVYTPRIAFRL